MEFFEYQSHDVISKFLKNREVVRCTKLMRSDADKLRDCLLLNGHVVQEASCFGCFLSRVNENQGLAFASLIQDLLESNLIRDLAALDGLLFSDTDKMLLKTARPVGGVKVEEALLLVHAQEGQEGRNILVIGQGSEETDQANVFNIHLSVLCGGWSSKQCSPKRGHVCCAESGFHQ